jgi:ribosomal protein L11 methyltransferase
MWGVLLATVRAELEEPLVAALAEGALGSESRFASPGRLELRVYYASAAEASARLPACREAMRAHRLDPAACRLRVEEVADGRWAERWQEGLRPFALGERFAVHPAGRVEAGAFPERLPILLVPGRAFGTGEHPTTRLAVLSLERHVRPGSRWLDLGTGTGLLALIAERLGAGEVVARDNDPDAVEVAREVLEANGARGIRLELGSTEGLPAAGFDGIVANIVAPFFLEHADVVGAALRGGGPLLATGLLEEETRELAARLRRAGLAVEASEADGPWRLLVARRT